MTAFTDTVEVSEFLNHAPPADDAHRVEYRFTCQDLADDFVVAGFSGQEELNSPYHFTITQNTVAHEFGHYLGIEHACQRPGADVGWCDPSPYCHERSQDLQENLMASGNLMHWRHANPWKRRLRRQHLFCDSAWSGRTL